MSIDRLHAVVVGGGLGGLTAALALRRRGIGVTVLEQAVELREIGAGIQTAPNASRILFDLGLGPALEGIRTQPEDQVRRRWRDGTILASRPLGREVQCQYGSPYWHYHRADLHDVLLEACLDQNGPGTPVVFGVGCHVVEIDRSSPERPAAVCADGTSHAADVVIGADGVQSRVRDAIGAPATLEFAGEMAYRALIPGDLVATDPATRFLFDRFHSTIWYGPERHLVHYFIRGGALLNVVAIVQARSPEDRYRSGSVDAREMVDEFSEWDSRVVSVLEKAGDDVTIWPMLHRRPDPRWVDGNVALLGDACHAMVPYQAQGASQAMEDAAVLAEELGRVGRSGVHEALVRYADRRARHAGLVQEASWQNKDLYHLPDGPEQRARDQALEDFAGESRLSYDWLWSGTPLADSRHEAFGYAFAPRPAGEA